jgi:uncharacterized protein involved in tolerance to divalent cations
MRQHCSADGIRIPLAGQDRIRQRVLLIIKTTDRAFDRLREALTSLHSYERPECIEIVVEDGSAAYLDWIGEAVR